MTRPLSWAVCSKTRKVISWLAKGIILSWKPANTKIFLNINPKIIVITNIDNDHLDYYGNLKMLKRHSGEFASKLDKDGFLVCDLSNDNLKEVVKKN